MDSYIVILSSVSPIKVETVRSFLKEHLTDRSLELITISTKDAPIPEQPVNSGLECARLRNEYLKTKIGDQKYDLLISIENDVVFGKRFDECDLIQDHCHVIIENNRGGKYTADAYAGGAPIKYFVDAKEATPADYPYLDKGLAVTMGSRVALEYPDIDPQDWMLDTRINPYASRSRTDSIREALFDVFEQKEDNDLLYNAVIRVPDHPKPGVVFQDMSNILADPYLMNGLYGKLEGYAVKFKGNGKRTVVVGLDARGFIYGSLLAHFGNFGFIMARKAGKLPGKTVQVEYGTEYSKDKLEIMPHLIDENTAAIIVDDLVATGGSLKAAVELVEKCGGSVLACLTILQVPELVETARKKLAPIPIDVLII